MKKLVIVVPFLLLLPSFGCHISIPAGPRVDVRLSESAERTEVHPLELMPGEVLELDSDYGTIQFAVGAGPGELRATVRASGRTREEAEAVLARYTVDRMRVSGALQGRLRGEPLTIDSGSLRTTLAAHVDWVATVPTGTSVRGTTRSGDVETQGPLGAVGISSDFGNLRVEQAGGDLSLRTGSGNLWVGRAGGAETRLESRFGSVRVEDAGEGALTCRSGSGDLHIARGGTGVLDLDTAYGSVTVEATAGPVRAHTGSGDLSIQGAIGAVHAKSEYGGVRVVGVLEELEVSSGSGDVKVEALEGSHATGAWSLVSRYGSVELAVPAGFACDLDARTSYGSVACDFPVTVAAGKRKGDSVLKGTVGAGGATVTLTSGSGDVALRKR